MSSLEEQVGDAHRRDRGRRSRHGEDERREAAEGAPPARDQAGRQVHHGQEEGGIPDVVRDEAREHERDGERDGPAATATVERRVDAEHDEGQVLGRDDVQVPELPEAEGREGIEEGRREGARPIPAPVEYVSPHREARQDEAREERRLVREDGVPGREVDRPEEGHVAEHVLRAGERRSCRVEGVGVEEAGRMRHERVRVPREHPHGEVQVALHEE